MKKLFYLGVFGLILFEIANVYFIMPMPGSQRIDSISFAYFLYSWRWVFRIVFVLMIIVEFLKVFKTSKVLPVILLVLLCIVTYVTNFVMAADHMFIQTKDILMSQGERNKTDTGKIIIGIVYKGESKAYPIQFIGYHHQLLDTISGKAVIVTYCTVCRTGRVFEPIVNGHAETFRLVGMDHFNAMFEDRTTKSWWRQATGQAITGKLTGQSLPEFASTQMSLGKWLSLYPNSFVMQPGEAFKDEYKAMEHYETGKSKSSLTYKDSLSWKDKSWVVGIVAGSSSKAYDWNRLKTERVIHDLIGKQPVVIILADSNSSFMAFKRESIEQKFQLTGDSLKWNGYSYNLMGQSNSSSATSLQKINAYQEYWHSWKTFHPATEQY